MLQAIVLAFMAAISSLSLEAGELKYSFIERINSLFFENKNTCYKEYSCNLNISKFISLMLGEDISISELENQVLVVNFSSANTDIDYGRKDFSCHVVLMVWDICENNWKIFDYDSDLIFDESFRRPIEAKEYLKNLFWNGLTESILKQRIERDDDYILLWRDLPQIKIFKLSEWLVFSETELYEPSIQYGIGSEYKIESGKQAISEEWEKNIPLNNLIQFLNFLEQNSLSLSSLRDIKRVKDKAISKGEAAYLYDFYFLD